MKAAVFHKSGNIQVNNVDDPTILDPIDVILKVTSTAICGSDLHILSGGWKGYLTYYNEPIPISQMHYFIALFLAHIVFGIISVNVFQLITDNPELWYERAARQSQNTLGSQPLIPNFFHHRNIIHFF